MFYNYPHFKSKPWVVLVSGLNGIRKTTSVYQPWFNEAVLASIKNTKKPKGQDNNDHHNLENIPCGSNSFFRQLDYMMATIANEDFKQLYTIEDVEKYSTFKVR